MDGELRNEYDERADGDEYGAPYFIEIEKFHRSEDQKHSAQNERKRGLRAAAEVGKIMCFHINSSSDNPR